jgi:hypothetical protein
VVALVSEATERLSGAWSSLVADVSATVVTGCRALKDRVGKSAPGWSFPVTLDPACRPAWTGPGTVEVAVRMRRVPVSLNRPVQVLRAVPNALPLVGPHGAVVPDLVPPQQDHVQVSITVQLEGGLYLGRVDDAMGTGTPFVIYLDGLP